MSTWLITLIALWIYPILTYFLVSWAQRRDKLTFVSLTILTITLLTTLFLLIDVSTTSTEFDWVLLTSYYFALCFLSWRLVKAKSVFVKVLGYVLTTLVFGVGYISCTIGVLGVGFVTAEFDPQKQEEIGRYLVYKETRLGNAISESRGVKIEIFKRYKYVPFIERRLSVNQYYGLPGIFEIAYNYNATTKNLRLTLDGQTEKSDSIDWVKEIKIE